MIKKEEYYTNQHSCFLLQYHFILVTKYRKPVIINSIKDFLIDYTQKYFKDRDFNILEINTNVDHIHILFECGPNTNLSTFVNAFKSASSRMIRKHFSKELSKYYWKPYFWNDSYFICTVSDKSAKVIQTYIQNQ